MIKDPNTTWDGPYPYDALAAAEVTPEFSHAQMADVSFALMRKRLMNPKTQKAWNELRDIDRRLLADILLYDIDLPAELQRAHAVIDAELAGLAEPAEPPHVAAALSVPEHWLGELAGELTDVPFPAPPRPEPPRFDTFPVRSPDHLIEFDR